jgi:hypothetical protein
MNNVIAYIATALGLALVITGWFIWGDIKNAPPIMAI